MTRDYYNPYNPCEVYLPTLTKKNQLNVGKYMQIYTIYMDPMGYK